MKILQVISSFPPAYSYGGPTKVAFSISKELVKNGHDVTVYTTDAYDSNSRLHYETNPEIMEGVKVYRFRNISNSLSRKNFSCAPSMFFFLKNNIKDFDIIHLHEFRSFQAIFVHHYAKKKQIPYILQAHGAVLPIFEKEELKKQFDNLWGDKIIKDAAKVIASTTIEANQYKILNVNSEKISIIPNGVEIQEYQHLPKKGSFKTKYHINPDNRIILSLGRLHKIKGIDLLIDAFSELRKTMRNVKLVIAGPDDGFLDSLKTQVNALQLQDSVFFTGRIDQNDKIAAYVDADVFVLSSIYECFAMTALEAWACGTPVIMTNGCHISEYFDKNEYIVDRNKINMSKAIQKILNDEKERQILINEGKKWIENEFDWLKIIDNYIITYEKIVNQKN